MEDESLYTCEIAEYESTAGRMRVCAHVVVAGVRLWDFTADQIADADHRARESVLNRTEAERNQDLLMALRVLEARANRTGEGAYLERPVLSRLVQLVEIVLGSRA